MHRVTITIESVSRKMYYRSGLASLTFLRYESGNDRHQLVRVERLGQQFRITERSWQRVSTVSTDKGEWDILVGDKGY